MGKIVAFIPSAAALLFGAGLEVSGVEIPWLGYGLMFLGAALLVIPAWPWLQENRPKARHERNNDILVTIVSEPDEKGYLDHVVDMPRALEELTTLLDKTSNETVKIGKKLGSQTKRVLRAQGEPTRILKIATAMARDVDRYSEKLAEIIPEMERACQKYETSWLGLVDWWNKNQHGWQTEFDAAFSQLEEFIPSMKGGIGGISSFRATAADTLEQNLAGNLTAALRRLLKRLDRHIDLLQNVQRVSEQVYLERQRIENCC